MTKIEILLKAATMNEQSLIRACEAYPIPKNRDEVTFLNELIDRVTDMRDNLPHGKGYAGARLIRTHMIDILNEKIEEYLINDLTKN